MLLRLLRRGVIGLDVGTATDIGQVRANNEDSHIALVPPEAPAGLAGVLAVADGMGGHIAGEIASQTAIESLLEELSHVGTVGVDEMDAIMRSTNREVLARARELHTLGMATTLTAAVLTDKGLIIGHIGDTRLYVMRRGRLEQVTQDHNVAAELVSSGAISAEEARTHPQRNVLTRTVGIDPATDPDVLQLRVRRGDRVLICSDGLHGLVASDQIAAVLSTGTPVFAANQLVEIANETGGSDNITAVVADVVRVRGRKMKRSSADTTSTNVSDDSTVEV